MIAHFLSVSDIPLIIDSRVVQPREFLERLLAEIEGREHSTSDYFDEPATVLDPNLLNDRGSDAPPSPGPPASDAHEMPPTPAPPEGGAQVARVGTAAFENPIRLIF